MGTKWLEPLIHKVLIVLSLCPPGSEFVPGFVPSGDKMARKPYFTRVSEGDKFCPLICPLLFIRPTAGCHGASPQTPIYS